MSETSDLLGSYADRQKAFNDLVRAVGENRLNSARAELNEAVALGEMERAALVDATLAQLQADMATVNATAATAQKRISATADLAHRALQLLQGRPISAYSMAVDAYKHFETIALAENGDALLAETFPRIALSADNFLCNDASSRFPIFPAVESYQNAVQLINQSFLYHLIAQPGSEAQRRFTHLFKAIGGVAQRTIDAITAHAERVKSGAYSAWQPIELAGIVPSEAEKRILGESSQATPPSAGALPMHEEVKQAMAQMEAVQAGPEHLGIAGGGGLLLSILGPTLQVAIGFLQGALGKLAAKNLPAVQAAVFKFSTPAEWKAAGDTCYMIAGTAAPVTAGPTTGGGVSQ